MSTSPRGTAWRCAINYEISVMNRQLRAALAHGLQWERAIGNDLGSFYSRKYALEFPIWGLAIYAGMLYFSNS